MPRIIIRFESGTKANTVEVFPVARFNSLYFGRDPTCDVRFDIHKDDVVSRNHAVIEWTKSDAPEFTISDLLSSNGTYLNGEKVTGPTRLSSGDKVQLGRKGPVVAVELDMRPGEDSSDLPTAVESAANPRRVNSISDVYATARFKRSDLTQGVASDADPAKVDKKS